MKVFFFIISFLYIAGDLPAQEKVTVKTQSVYRHRHEEPVFPGTGNSGENEQKYFEANQQYPDFARKSKIEGVVVVEYTVNAKGDTETPRIKKPVHPLLDAEAIRLIEHMPQWQPAKSGETAVTCLRTSTIVFKL